MTLISTRKRLGRLSGIRRIGAVSRGMSEAAQAKAPLTPARAKCLNMPVPKNGTGCPVANAKVFKGAEMTQFRERKLTRFDKWSIGCATLFILAICAYAIWLTFLR